MIKILSEIKKNSKYLLSMSEEDRICALTNLASDLIFNQKKILIENSKDIKNAQKNKLNPNIIDRLKLDVAKITAMSNNCLEIAKQPQVVGDIVEEYIRPNGLVIKKQRIPLGVIAMIFESRPNVVIDALALAIKSGNALVLKGGKEARFSNQVLFDIALKSFKNIFPKKLFLLLESREAVTKLLKMDQCIDLVIARGGSSLVNYVKKNAAMPVCAHDKGLCQMYVNEDADEKYVNEVVINAKLSRPGVCNALESLIIHEKYPGIKKLVNVLISSGVEIRGCSQSKKINSKVKLASKKDYDTEYLDRKISLKIVKNAGEALEHMINHSSHHTEAILSKDQKVIDKFLNNLDSSCVVVNTSTRFNDGGELGLGAELGISTSKFHAYGPMGAKEMTTTRYIVVGQGQVR